jgi:F-type H+-transporting ATPase subunit b
MIAFIQAAQASAQAAGEHAQSSGLPQFDTSTFSSQAFWSVVSFFVLVALMNKYVLPAIQNILDARSKSIQEEIESGRKSREEADKVLEEYRRMLSTARETSAQIMEETRRETAVYRDNALRELEQEIAQRQASALKEIDQMKRQAMQEISGHAVAIAMMATEKLMARAVTDADATRMVEDAIAQLDRQSSPVVH